MYRIITVLAFALALMLTIEFSSEAEADTELASYYGPGLYGNLTASGDVLTYGDYGAASLKYPLGTVLRVCYVGCTVVVVNDRGPYVADRTLDLQQAPAEDIGLIYPGVDYVEANIVR